jgi:predicted nucleic acid-binding Zn ribbon protein
MDQDSAHGQYSCVLCGADLRRPSKLCPKCRAEIEHTLAQSKKRVKLAYALAFFTIGLSFMVYGYFVDGPDWLFILPGLFVFIIGSLQLFVKLRFEKRLERLLSEDKAERGKFSSAG